jgi:hypothetical protein
MPRCTMPRWRNDERAPRGRNATPLRHLESGLESKMATGVAPQVWRPKQAGCPEQQQQQQQQSGTSNAEPENDSRNTRRAEQRQRAWEQQQQQPQFWMMIGQQQQQIWELGEEVRWLREELSQQAVLVGSLQWQVRRFWNEKDEAGEAKEEEEEKEVALEPSTPGEAEKFEIHSEGEEEPEEKGGDEYDENWAEHEVSEIQTPPWIENNGGQTPEEWDAVLEEEKREVVEIQHRVWSESDVDVEVTEVWWPGEFLELVHIAKEMMRKKEERARAAAKKREEIEDEGKRGVEELEIFFQEESQKDREEEEGEEKEKAQEEIESQEEKESEDSWLESKVEKASPAEEVDTGEDFWSAENVKAARLEQLWGNLEGKWKGFLQGERQLHVVTPVTRGDIMNKIYAVKSRSTLGFGGFKIYLRHGTLRREEGGIKYETKGYVHREKTASNVYWLDLEKSAVEGEEQLCWVKSTDTSELWWKRDKDLGGDVWGEWNRKKGSEESASSSHRKKGPEEPGSSSKWVRKC